MAHAYRTPQGCHAMSVRHGCKELDSLLTSGQVGYLQSARCDRAVEIGKAGGSTPSQTAVRKHTAGLDSARVGLGREGDRERAADPLQLFAPLLDILRSVSPGQQQLIGLMLDKQLLLAILLVLQQVELRVPHVIAVLGRESRQRIIQPGPKLA
eukprot:4721597-Prymnesium_polylepis.1